MVAFKCKMCGGDLYPAENASTCECGFCGTLQTVPSADNEKKLSLFGRAQRLLFACEFDKASGIYESIIAEFPAEAEAYWGLVLCKYGIEYVDDPGTGKKIPTCHRTSFESVFDDPDYEQAAENADPAARRVYRNEAKAIEELRKQIIEVSGREEPYDIFICYKETDENGDRTLDSVLAQDIYTELTENGYRVFFSRISLEDRLGQEYEPYIFAALNSAKIMLAVGTDYEYYNSVWVKNEWSRFLKLISAGAKKTLIPCYKNIDAYDLPKEFYKLQAQDLGKVGAMQDLLRGIRKIISPGDGAGRQEQPDPRVAALLEKAALFLEDSNWDKAKEYYEQILEDEPKTADAYLGLLMCELQVSGWEAFMAKYADSESSISENVNYIRARRFAAGRLKNRFSQLDQFVQEKSAAQEAEWQQEKAAVLSRAEELVTADGIIVAEESMSVDTQVEAVPGIVFRHGFLSSYFVTDNDTMEAELDNPFIFLCAEEINGIHSILPLLEQVVQKGYKLLIICHEMDHECLNTLIVNKLRGTFTSVAVSVPGESGKFNALLEDIAACTGARVYYSHLSGPMENVTTDMLGSAYKTVISKDCTVVLCKPENREKISSRISGLSGHLEETSDELEKQALEDRINTLNRGIALIRVGGDSENEIKEKTVFLKNDLADRRMVQMGTAVSPEQRAEIRKELISRLLEEAVRKAGTEGVVVADNSKRINSSVINVRGMRFPRGYLSSYMITNQEDQEAILYEPLVLLSDEPVSSIQDMLPVLEKMVQSGKSSLIVAPDYSREVEDTLTMNVRKGILHGVVVKAPGTAVQQHEYIMDLSVLTGASVVSSKKSCTWADMNMDLLGHAGQVIATKKSTTVVQNLKSDEHLEQNISTRLGWIRERILSAQSEDEKLELYEHYSKLNCGAAFIWVGGDTEEEIMIRENIIKTELTAQTRKTEAGYASALREQLASDEEKWIAEEEQKKAAAREKAERERIEALEKAEKARIEAKKKRADEERRHAMQELARKRTILQNEYNYHQSELAELKGLFARSRRQEILARMAEIESELQNLGR